MCSRLCSAPSQPSLPRRHLASRSTATPSKAATVSGLWAVLAPSYPDSGLLIGWMTSSCAHVRNTQPWSTEDDSPRCHPRAQAASVPHPASTPPRSRRTHPAPVPPTSSPPALASLRSATSPVMASSLLYTVTSSANQARPRRSEWWRASADQPRGKVWRWQWRVTLSPSLRPSLVMAGVCRGVRCATGSVCSKLSNGLGVCTYRCEEGGALLYVAV